MSNPRTLLDRRRFLGVLTAGAAGMAFAPPRALHANARKASQTHRQRIESALSLKETDRLPFGFWWHFPNQDRSPRRLAELSLDLQRTLDLDFIKFSPYGLYSVVDWGVILDVKGGGEPPVPAQYPIRMPDDWRKLRRLGGIEGEYLVVLEAQRILLAEMKSRVPLVQTIFSPLTSCLKLAGPETLLAHIREAPEAVHAGLEIIADTTRRFAVEVVHRGADGVFFASQTASADYLTPVEYAAFAKRYDLIVLDAVRRQSWFNILHLHGERPMFDQILDYPVQAINYHDREAGPPLAEVRERTQKCLIGGIAENTVLVRGTTSEIDAQVKNAWEQVGQRGLILGPGCVANLQAPQASVLRLRAAVEATQA